MNINFQSYPGPQTEFLENTADELLFASCLGAGKSLTLLADVSRYISLPGFTALILRSTYAELEKQLISKFAQQTLKWDTDITKGGCGAKYNQGKHLFTFPSGARIYFGSMDNDSDLNKYRGIDWNYLGFDELTNFSWEQVEYLKLWLRRSKEHPDLPLLFRCTSNAGGISHDDVKEYWKYWLSGQSKKKLKSGQIVKVNGRTRSCILAHMGDNPYIDAETYQNIFKGKPQLVVEQLLNNNWDAKPSSCMYFRRELIKTIPAAPTRIARVIRGWDLASVENGGDYTVGLLLGELEDKSLVVLDMVRRQINSADVEKLLLSTSKSDTAWRGSNVKTVLPLDPGQAANSQKLHLSQLLSGFNFVFEATNNQKAKAKRAEPISAQALSGNLSVVNAPWNAAFFNELEDFSDDPKTYKHDDCVDALSSAYTNLLNAPAILNKIDDSDLLKWENSAAEESIWSNSLNLKDE